MKKEFIGKKYSTVAEKEQILNGYDKFQMKKLLFLKETQKTENTMLTYWRLIDSNIHDIEITLNKDLMKFSDVEIETLLSTKVSYAKPLKATLATIIRQYFLWGISRGELILSPLENVNVNNFLKDEKGFLEQKIFSINYMREFFSNIEKQLDPVFMLPFLFARYGILGKDKSFMINSKWEDIDYDKKLFYIYNKDRTVIISKVIIDNFFIDTIKYIYSYMRDNDLLMEGDSYIFVSISKKKNNINNIMTSRGLWSRMCVVKNTLGFIPKLNDLLYSRIFELLLKIREERKICKYDLENINDMFLLGNTEGVFYKLKRIWNTLLPDDIIVSEIEMNTKTLKDDNAYNYANKIADENNINLKEIAKLIV